MYDMHSKEKEVLYSPSGDKDQDEKILEPLTYTLLPPKKLEMKFILSFNHWFKLPVEKLEPLIDVGYYITYKYISIIDDISDDSELRENIPSAHIVYGNAKAIYAANYGLLIALERLLSLKNPQVVQVYVEEFLKYHRGAGIEIYWRDNFTCPTEAEYRDICIQKITGYFNASIKMMQLFSDCKIDFGRLIELVCLYIMYGDDYNDLVSVKDMESSAFCADLSEGKFNLPIIHAIQHSNTADRDQILNMLRQKPKNLEVKKYFINLLNKSGSLAYTRQVILDIDKQAREEMEKLGGNPQLLSVLDGIKNRTFGYL